MFVAILIIIVVLSVLTVYLVNKKPQSKVLFQVVYSILIVVLSVLLIIKINEPIKFNKERKKREAVTIERLKDIRTVQVAYKDKYGKYTASFDTLINFVKNDSFLLPQIVQVAPWNQDEMSKEEALKAGILRKSEFKKAVKDSLITADYSIEDIRYVPFTNKVEFKMGAGEVETGSQVKVKVFEAYALFNDLFNGMDKQLIINYKDERYKITSFEGLKVGSLTEATNNAGNWEK